MAPDTPEREPEMQDTPPCRCPTKWRCLVRLRFFLRPIWTPRHGWGYLRSVCSPRRRATDGGAFGLLQAVWELLMRLCYQLLDGFTSR